jgi:hypothetical protein
MRTTLYQKLKTYVGSFAWGIFLWSIGLTEEEYWKLIYEQEKREREKNQ